LTDKIDLVDFVNKMQNYQPDIEVGEYPSYETYKVEIDYGDHGQLFILVSDNKNKLDSLTKSIRNNLDKLSKEPLFISDNNPKPEKFLNSVSAKLARHKNKTVSGKSAELEGQKYQFDITLSFLHNLDGVIDNHVSTLSYLAGLSGISLVNFRFEDREKLPKYVNELYNMHLETMNELKKETKV